MLDWQDFAEKWAHKLFNGHKRNFFKKRFVASQMQFVSTNQLPSEKDQQNNELVCETAKDVHLEKVFDNSINMSHLGWTMMKNGVKFVIKIYQLKAGYDHPKRFR